MNSKKSMLLLTALIVLGGITISQFTIQPAIAFILGVVTTAFLLNFSTSTPSSTNKDAEQSTQTLYVGNLPYKANESHVRDLFAEHGEVFAVRLMKDKRTGKRRGFGFVVMAAADAEPAIEALNEKDYMQRTLKVRIANDPKSQSDSTEQG